MVMEHSQIFYDFFLIQTFIANFARSICGSQSPGRPKGHGSTESWGHGSLQVAAQVPPPLGYDELIDSSDFLSEIDGEIWGKNMGKLAFDG